MEFFNNLVDKASKKIEEILQSDTDKEQNRLKELREQLVDKLEILPNSKVQEIMISLDKQSGEYVNISDEVRSKSSIYDLLMEHFDSEIQLVGDRISRMEYVKSISDENIDNFVNSAKKLKIL